MDSAWISMSRKTVRDIRASGLRAYYTLSPKGAWHALTSKYWFYNSYSSDIMYAFSGGAVCINLWHGVGLKRIEFNIQSGSLVNRYKYKKFSERFYHPEVFKRPSWLLSSTPFQTEMLASAFRVDYAHCLELGYPRNEILTCPEILRQKYITSFENEQTQNIITQIKAGHYHKVYVYMPTWRDSQREIFVQSFDLATINGILQKQNSLLLLKPHANVIIDNAIANQFANILLVNGKSDIYPILPYTDVLITDYSSILYDYVLMDKKDVILYLYDYREYLQERDLFHPFDENVVGKKVSDFDQLCNCIEQLDFDIDVDKKNEIVEKFWGSTTTLNASKEIFDFLDNVNSKSR